MIKRRTILSAVGAAMAPGSLWPQPAAKVYRVGVMTYNLHPFDPFIPMIVDALNGRGYEEGHNLVIDHVDAKGRPERLPALAAELVARKPDVILGASNRSALHHKQASLTIPIVMVLGLGQLLVESGLVASLARPGGNVTGVIVPPDLPAGLFTTLRGVVPRLKSAALLWDPAGPVIEVADQVCARAAAAMGIRLAVLQAASKEALE